MKALNVKSRGFIIAASIVGVISVAGGTAVALNINTPKNDTKQSVVAAKEVVKTETQPTETPAQPVVETPEVAPQPVATTVVETPAPAPVLSTQEYAEKYLDVSSPILQKCLDRIVEIWPDRFTPEVRERNIKALRIWTSVCSTTVFNPVTDSYIREGTKTLHGSLIASYGDNGEFFDTDIAKSQW